MKKKGISAVVATILIILIVVVGVGIVWKVVFPLFAELEFLSYSDVRLNIVFQGHTVYDSEQHFAFVQIERGKDEVNVTGIEIGFNFDGTTKTYQSRNVPTPNGKYTYKFNFTNDSDMGIPQDVAPDRVTVAPIFTINNKERLGKILDEKPMPSGRIHLSVEEWEKANDEAATAIVVSTGSGGGDEPGEPVVPEEPEVECGGGEVEYNGGCAIEVTECETLNQAGKYYKLNNSITDPVLRTWAAGSPQSCFVINAADVTFDLAGHRITADTGGNGISIINTGATIKNGEIYDFATAIYLFGSGNTLTNLIVNSNDQGIFIAESSDNILTDITANNNSLRGIYLFQMSNQIRSENILTDITINSNGGDGILISGGFGNILTDITANNNSLRGIRLSDTFNNILNDVIANDNEENGIYLSIALDNVFTNITVNENFGGGISLDESSGNNFIDITANSNGGAGIYMFASSDGTFRDITSNENRGSGIWIVISSERNNFTDVIVNNNSENGISLFPSTTSNNFMNVITNNNSLDGIFLDQSSYNTFKNINSYRGEIGISLGESSANVFTNLNLSSHLTAGISISDSPYNNFTNAIVSSSKKGLYIWDSFNNILLNVTTRLSEDVGIDLYGGSGNQIINSTSCGHEQFGSPWDVTFGIFEDCSGTGNKFDNLLGSCINGWPEVGIHYTSC